MSTFNPCSIGADTERYTKPKPNRPTGTSAKRVNSACPQKRPKTKLQRRLSARLIDYDKFMKPKEDIGKGLKYQKPGSFTR